MGQAEGDADWLRQKRVAFLSTRSLLGENLSTIPLTLGLLAAYIRCLEDSKIARGVTYE